MPIKPENKDRYPANWKDIRKSILKRAQNRCEKCGVENHTPYTRLRDRKVVRHVLTIAHISEEIEDCSPGNLLALCCFCHNGMDAKMRAQHRKETLESKNKEI